MPVSAAPQTTRTYTAAKMCSAANTHLSTTGTKAPRSKSSSRRCSEQQGCKKRSITSLANLSGSISKYKSSLQAYHLQTFPTHRKRKRSGSQRKKSKKSPQRSNILKHGFQEKGFIQAFPLSTPQTPASASHDLYIQRTYLLSTLKREDQRATAILEQIQLIQQYLELPFHHPDFQENANSEESGVLHEANAASRILTRPFPLVNKRKLVRKLNHLKNRLGETTKQELYMLAQIENINSKIQSSAELSTAEEEDQWDQWGFADAVNLHAYGLGLGGTGGAGGQDGFGSIANEGKGYRSRPGSDTPRSAVSPGTLTPVEQEVKAVETRALDPRSPIFTPSTPFDKARTRKHSIVNWAEPQYEHIMEEVKKQQAQSPTADKGDTQPLFSLPDNSHRSSLIDWNEPQFQHILDEVRQVQEQHALKMDFKCVPGLKTVQIQQAPEHRLIRTSVISIDIEEGSPRSNSPSPNFGSTSTDPMVMVSSVESTLPDISKPNGLEAEIKRERQISWQENYRAGLAKIRAASVNYGQTFKDYGSDEDSEDGMPMNVRSSWSAGTSPVMRKPEIEEMVEEMTQKMGAVHVGYGISVSGSVPSPCRGSLEGDFDDMEIL